MSAGSYKSTSATYWARCKDGGCTDIISNDFQASATTMRFTCKKGEYVTVDGTFTKVG
jgi:hypothetical protein